MTTKEYNGWTNYETWLVKLWMDNEEGSYNHWQEAAQEEWDAAGNMSSASFTRSEKACLALSDALKESHEQAANDACGSSGFICDLVNAALSEVNWKEIAESLLTDVVEEYGKDAKVLS